jgi:hypothetical protein
MCYIILVHYWLSIDNMDCINSIKLAALDMLVTVYTMMLLGICDTPIANDANAIVLSELAAAITGVSYESIVETPSEWGGADLCVSARPQVMQTR